MMLVSAPLLLCVTPFFYGSGVDRYGSRVRRISKKRCHC
jgi:hypothetical protein